MKILVTGGLGYIGSHTVVELYNAGHEVVILDNLSNTKEQTLTRLKQITGKLFPFYKIDVQDLEGLKSVFKNEEQIDGVIHFAAKKSVSESLQIPLSYYENNIVGLINILRMVEDFEVRQFVFSSSCTVYGTPSNIPVNENFTTTKSVTPYGNTKLWGEQIIEEYAGLIKNFNAILLRYFNPVGAHSSALIGELPLGIPANLMPFITQTAAGWRDTLKIFGDDYNTKDGTAVRDYIHVQDLANAHVKALEYAAEKTLKNHCDTFNIGTGNGISVNEVVNAFQKYNDIKIKFEYAPRREGDIEQIWAETTKVNELLDWKAKYSLKEMVTSAWKWQKTLTMEN